MKDNSTSFTFPSDDYNKMVLRELQKELSEYLRRVYGNSLKTWPPEPPSKEGEW